MINKFTIQRNHLLLIVQTIILLIFALGNFLNMDAGWANNGDFERVAALFTSRPIDNEAWPEVGTEAWNRRFFRYYNPQWTLELGRPRLFSSAMLLWTPGVLLNRYFYAADTLSLPVMSLGARGLLFIFLLLVFFWIKRRSTHPLFHHFTIALPLALLFSTTDITAFFNSFYQESAAIVFVPYLIAVILLGRFVERDWKYYLLYFFVLFLVVTSKSANIYWPVLALPFVVPISHRIQNPVRFLIVAFVLVAVPVLLSLKLTDVQNITSNARPYNSLFTGTLLLSENPQQRLNELGLGNLSSCVGKDYYATQEGFDCAARYPKEISYWAVLKTMLHEPNIVVRQLETILNDLHNYSLKLGKYAFGDDTIRQEKVLNFWSKFAYSTFPKGWLVVGLMPFLLGLIWLSRNHKDITGDLAVCALIFLGAFWVDSFVEIWGDGQRDLHKHMVMPNIFFDFAWISSLNLIVLLAIDRGKQTRILGIFSKPPLKEVAKS